MINGVTENGIQYYQTGEHEFLCMYYFGEGYQNEITLNDIDKVHKLTLDDFVQKNESS